MTEAAAAGAATRTNDDMVTKLNGSLDTFIKQIETSEDAGKITTDIPGFLKIFRQTLVEYDPTRAGLFKICMGLSQIDNKALYDAYVVECTNNGKKYYNRSTFSEAQFQLGGILVRLFENTDRQWRRR